MALQPPRGGTPPPEIARVGGAELALKPLATEICRRYREEYPDEAERYGDAGIEWCVHDNQHILAWAAQDTAGASGLLQAQVDWLGGVLAARDFPLDRLARDLELAAEVVRPEAPAVADALAAVRVTPPAA
jgi:hypothetical protein